MILTVALFLHAQIQSEEFRPIKSEITNFRRLGTKWQSVIQENAGYQRRVVLNRNGKRVFSQTVDQMYIRAKMTDFRLTYPVYQVQTQTGMGQGGETFYYRLHSKGAKLILFVDIALPQPEFRDLDKDGQFEWMFLNGDRDKYDGKPTNNYVVYKVTPSKELKFWKKIPRSLVKKS